ncbi:hypothetical protein Aduo_013607 [Ancylostoma duodenale]
MTKPVEVKKTKEEKEAQPTSIPYEVAQASTRHLTLIVPGGSPVTTSQPVTSATEEVSTFLRREDVEKACYKLCRTGVSLISLVCNENETLHQEVVVARQEGKNELAAIVKDLKDRHESQPELAQIAQPLDKLREKINTDNITIQTQITTWKGDVWTAVFSSRRRLALSPKSIL